MSDGLIKICGLSTPDAAIAAATAGADLMGFVFAPSRRQVTPEQVATIVKQVRLLEDPPITVGLFSNVNAAEINQKSQAAAVDFVQVHGITDVAEHEAIELPYIVVLSSKPGLRVSDLTDLMNALTKSKRPPLWFNLDGFKPGESGGTGILADWELARGLAESFPVMLAGGLSAENVAESIATVRPYGVDVSSGVETDGVKDPEKIRAFVSNARQAFENLA